MSQNSTNSIACITPIKNEDWIIDTFVKSASKWAGSIIIANQGKVTSKLKKIVRDNPIVHLVQNNSTDLDESFRQKILLSEARKRKNNIILALDADEVLIFKRDPNKIWREIKSFPSGTMLALDWLNISPDCQRYSLVKKKIFGVVDDNQALPNDGIIHLERIPQTSSGLIHYVKDIQVIHLQYLDWERMLSKQRWYQILEILLDPSISRIKLYRKYHHMYSWNKNDLHNIPRELAAKINQAGISFPRLLQHSQKQGYWWDQEVVKLVYANNILRFTRIDFGLLTKNIYQKNDPRSLFDKLLLNYLKISQAHINRTIIQIIDKVMIKFGL